MATTIHQGGHDVELDPDLLKFNEMTLNQFLQNYASKYSYYSEKHAEAMYIHSCFQDRFDVIKSEKFREFKELGATEKLAEAKALANVEVQASLESVRISKHNVNLLYGYLRSMDRAHEDAISLGHNMRKEMDKIFHGIKTPAVS